MATLPDASIDCVLTDPPYGTTACKWDSVIPFEPMWKELKRIAKPKAAICLFGSQPFTSALVMSNPKMFRYELIWSKGAGSSPGLAKYRPMPSHENILLFGRETLTYTPQMRQGFKAWQKQDTPKQRVNNEHKYGYGSIFKQGTDERYPLSVVNSPRYKGTNDSLNVHPTQKPVELLRYLIRTYTLENETVFDFTMGSGSTGVACELENRNFIGIEKDAEYFKIATNRIEGVKKKEPLFAAA